jgi:hypothetical protein
MKGAFAGFWKRWVSPSFISIALDAGVLGLGESRAIWPLGGSCGPRYERVLSPRGVFGHSPPGWEGVGGPGGNRSSMGDEDDGRTSYTSEFLDSVSELPIELKKCFSLIRDLDEYVYELMDGEPQLSSSDGVPGVETMKRKMVRCVFDCPATFHPSVRYRLNLTCACRRPHPLILYCRTCGSFAGTVTKGTLDKGSMTKMKKMWSDIKAAQAKVLEIAAEKGEIATQAQRHLTIHTKRLEDLHEKFAKELNKTDPDGLDEVTSGAPFDEARSKPAPTQRKKKPRKQPKRQELVGSWIAIEYDDGSVPVNPDGVAEKVWYNGLVMAYDDNLSSYLISWEVRLHVQFMICVVSRSSRAHSSADAALHRWAARSGSTI